MLQLQEKSINEYSTKLSIFFGCKLYFFSVFEVGIEGRFEGIDMDEPIKEAEVYSGCFLLVLFGGKSAI